MNRKHLPNMQLFLTVTMSVYFVIASCTMQTEAVKKPLEKVGNKQGASIPVSNRSAQQPDTPSCCMKIPSRFGSVTKGISTDQSNNRATKLNP
jgi:hypothetical protein